MTTTARKALRTQLDSGRIVIAPGVFDGLSAHLLKRAGHTAAYMTGAGVAACGYGLPDIGLVTQTEMTDRARILVEVLDDIPLVADADTGYGTLTNVIRTVRQYEAAGVAAIQLEDQAFPKRCGHLPGKVLVTQAEFEQTLRSARDARTDEGMLIIARTDARAVWGLDAAIERANGFAQAGADIIFVEAPQSIEEIERIAREVDGLLLINLVDGGLTPMQSAARLQEVGYAIAIHPGVALFAAAAAMADQFQELSGDSAAAGHPKTPAQFFDIVGMAEWMALDDKYGKATTTP